MGPLVLWAVSGIAGAMRAVRVEGPVAFLDPRALAWGPESLCVAACPCWVCEPMCSLEAGDPPAVNECYRVTAVCRRHQAGSRVPAPIRFGFYKLEPLSLFGDISERLCTWFPPQSAPVLKT